MLCPRCEDKGEKVTWECVDSRYSRENGIITIRRKRVCPKCDLTRVNFEKIVYKTYLLPT